MGIAIGGFGIAFYRGSVYTCMMLAYIPIIVILIVCLGKSLKKAAALKLETNQELGGFTEECLSAMKLVVSFSREDFIQKKFTEKAKVTQKVSKKASFFSAMFFGLIRCFMFGFFVYANGLAIVLVHKKVTNPNSGKPYTVQDIIAVTQSMIMAISQGLAIIPNITNVAKASVVGKKVFDVLERKPAIRDSDQTDKTYKVDIREHISFENVKFRYPTTPT
jgi:ABC-type multidrug transport system fused ATPase/permease subunit